MGRELTLRETQLAALEVLKIVDAVCREKELRYYLAYGSLIGALRHSGFIPWDDDLDICMPRDDFERLIEYFRSECDIGYIQLVYDTKEHPLPFLCARISDTRYKMVGEFGDYINELGAFIDIYPLDGLGNEYKAACERKRRVQGDILKYLRLANFPYWRNQAMGLKRKLKVLYSKVAGSACVAREKLLAEVRALHYDDSKYVTCLQWITYLPFCERTWLGEPQDAMFEGIHVLIPADPDSVLREIYGDYMTMPPESERVGHHVYRLYVRDNEAGGQR